MGVILRHRSGSKKSWQPEVMQWYFSDRQRMKELQMSVTENNVIEFVFSQAKVTEKVLPFNELMGVQ